MHLSPRTSASFLLTASALCFAPAGAAQDPGADPVEAYRTFIEALREASSLQEISSHFPAEMRTRMADIGEEQGLQFLARLREQMRDVPDGGGDVVAREIEGNRAEIVTRATRNEGIARVTMESTVQLVRESDGWKIERPGSWSDVEVLPLTPLPEVAPRSVGPGAADGPAGGYDVTAYELTGEVEEAGRDWEGAVVFDPRGHYVALGNRRSSRIRLLELDGLREAWSVQTDHSSLGFSADGRALAVIAGSGYVPEVIPLAPNLELAAPGGAYFFSRPALPAAADAIDGTVRWGRVAYHPREPLLALALGDHEDDSAGALVLQPTGDGLWRSDAPDPVAVWRTDGAPDRVRWAADGSRLAWIPFLSEPGSPAYVRDHPASGEGVALSRPGFLPTDLRLGSAGRLLAVTGWSGDSPGVVVWNLESGSELAWLPGIARVAFAPDGRHLLAVRDTGMDLEPGIGDEILVWEIGAQEPGHAISAFPPGEDDRPHFVAGLDVSPNGRFLVAVSDRGAVRLWDAGER